MAIGIGLLQLLVIPPIVLIVATFSLAHFQNAYRLVLSSLLNLSNMPAAKTFRPYINNARSSLEKVLGKASGLKFNLTHVLMMGVIIMLLAVYSVIQKNNDLQEQRIRAKLRKNKKHND